MQDITQVERQLYILSLLSENHRGYSIEEISTHLNRIGIDVSRKTVERDIDFISSNFFVYEEERNGKAYYIANKYNVKNITFTVSQLVSLYFAREVMSSYSSLDVGAAAQKILDRLIIAAPKINQVYINTLSEMIKVYISNITQEKDINPEFMEIIRDSIAEKRSLNIEYHAFNSDETTVRIFDPYLLEINEGCWHLVGYCHLRHEIRNLRVSRIIDTNKSEQTFERPENFYEAYKESRFEKLSGNEKTNMKFYFKGDSARYIQEYESQKADSITLDDKGGLIFERTTAITKEIVKWVLGFGREVEVLEPEELRNEIKEEIKKMYSVYI